MKRLFTLAVVATLVGAAAWFYWPSAKEGAGPTLQVLFDRHHDLSPGDPVSLEGQQIGEVVAVEPEGQSMRVKIRLHGQGARSIPSDSTFKVERGWLGGRQLAGHVLDPESPPLESGATVEGADSTLELLAKQGQGKAARALEDFKESGWFRKTERLMGELEEALEEFDWEELGEEMRSDLERMSRDLAALAGLTDEAARDGYRKLKPEIEKLIRELEALGKSQEAERLRRHLEELFERGKESSTS